MAAWPLLKNYPGQEFQSGLFGTWMFSQYDGPKPEKASHPPLPPLPGGGRRIPPPPRPSKGSTTTAPPDEVPASASTDSPHPHGDELPVEPPVHPAVEEPSSDTVTQSHEDDEPSLMLEHDEPGGDELPIDAPTSEYAD